MINAQVNPAQIEQLKRAITGTRRVINKELQIAIGQASRDCIKIVAKGVVKELNVPQKAVKDVMPKPVVKKSENPSATVVLKKQARFSLKRFKARQTRAGVSYRVDKKKGVSRVSGAFMGPNPKVKSPRLGGHVFKRLGKARKPIVKLHGASPWGAFIGRNLRPPTLRETSHALHKRLARRIRDAIRKKEGKF